MTPPDLSRVEEGAPIAEVKLPAEFSPNAQIGKTVFESKCAVCHGANAAGQNGVAPPLVHKIYEPSHHSDMAFVLAAQNGVRSHHWTFGDMPPVEGVAQGDVKMVANYIRELQRDGTIPGAMHVPRGMLEFWIDPESPYFRKEFEAAESLILFCNKGWRSALAAQTLKRMGAQGVAHMSGGMENWKAEGGAIETPPSA